MSRRNLYWLLGIVALSMLGMAVSYSAPTREKDQDYDLVRLVVDVLHEVDTKYVVDLDPDRKRKLVEDMINGGLERLDLHSQYINPKDYKGFERNNKGKFGGIGIQLGMDRGNRGQLMVTTPLPGTPAFKAGVMANDAILKIDGKSTETMRLNEAIDLIQGDPGQQVVLTVKHENGKEADIPIVRAEIKIQSVMGDQRKGEEWDFFIDRKYRIGYIRLTSFSETAAAEMKAALESLLQDKDGVRGLVLDLRNNPGGLLRAAVEISNFFLKQGRIVSTKGRDHKDDVHDAQPENALPFPESFPIAILVNQYSASASEIVAAALQDNNRAVVVGERSYGKGSVQNVIVMGKEKEPSALKLTTASYWRPSGKNIHRFPDSKETDDWGVRPNPGLEVPMKDDERYQYLIYRMDRDVFRTEENPKKPKQNKETARTPVPASLSGDSASCPTLLQMPWGPAYKSSEKFRDRVLEKALDYLRKQLSDGKAAVMPPVQGNA